jgi:hypothetical protein
LPAKTTGRAMREDRSSSPRPARLKDGADLMEYLLSADEIPLGMKETSREPDRYGEAGASIEIATQEMEGPPVKWEDPNDPNPYPDVNPVLPPMNEGYDPEWERKSKAVQEWVERQSKKSRRKQLAARLVLQRVSPAMLEAVVFKLVVVRSEQEASTLKKGPDGVYRTDEDAHRLVLLYKRGDLIVALGCDPANGDMQFLEKLKPVVDRHIDAVDADRK